MTSEVDGTRAPVDAPYDPVGDDGAGADHAAERDEIEIDDGDSSIAQHDGRRRRRQALLVIGVAVLAGLGGILIGTQVRSPADEAASRQPPPASRITVAVARQRLDSTLVLSGTVEFDEPANVVLAGPVGLPSDEVQVVTRFPAVDAVIEEGDAPFDVSGRPVVFLQGELPMYRRLTVGTDGPDVAQLEVALERLGLDPGPVDTLFDQATADALAALYASIGYLPEGPSRDEREALRVARVALDDALVGLRAAETALANGGATQTESERIQSQQSLDAARAAVPSAQSQAVDDNESAAAAVVAARTVRNAAGSLRNEAVAARDRAAGGSIDPETGAPHTAESRSELAAAAARADEELAMAESALVAAINAQESTAASGQRAIKEAQDQLVLAEAQFKEAGETPDTSALVAAVDDAKGVVERSESDVELLETASGPRVAPGEVVFLPALPTTVTDVFTRLGGPATEQLATVASSQTSVVAAVSRADSSFVETGAAVTIELRDVSLDVPGTVVSIGAPPASGQAGDEGQSGGSSGRLQVVIAPDDPDALSEFVFSGARIRISVDATDGEVLVVPVAALFVGSGGGSKVEVETEPITAQDEGSTRIVDVEVGLSSQGLAEIRPVDGAVDVGDRVVVGMERSGGDSDAPSTSEG